MDIVLLVGWPKWLTMTRFELASAMVGIEPKYISNIAALPIELHGRCYSVIKHLPPSVPVSSSKMELTLDTETEHTDQLRI